VILHGNGAARSKCRAATRTRRLLKKVQDLNIALPPNRIGITAKELQALICEDNANCNTASGAIIWDLCSQMGMGVRRDGDRYYGSLPEGVTSAVRQQAPARMAANTAAACKK
jgi:hypothetical protein